ncbi:MAG: TetR family transcriptional regulator [Oxalobacteraceae bacterium]|nr:MAG: TetR family transcriptional regulator [Oxalobacteraceae bacterium]
MGQVRESKKKATRERISDVATELFFARGFDGVTVDEIAVAAQVSKMTIFNYFARKEELILDREDDLKLMPFQRALRERSPEQGPVDALRVLIAEMDKQKHPICHISSMAADWWRVVEASPVLMARMRELGDEAAAGLAAELGGAASSGATRLMAGTIVLTVRTAREGALRQFQNTASTKKANATFMQLMKLGLSAIEQMADISARPSI